MDTLPLYDGVIDGDTLPQPELDGDAGCVVGYALKLVVTHGDTLDDADTLPL